MSNDFDSMMQGGKAFPFDNVGDKFVDAEIVGKEVVQFTNDDGTTRDAPKLSLRLVDGTDSAIYLTGNKWTQARAALTAAGADSFTVGGKVSFALVEIGEPSRRGFSGPKLYKAKYTPPAAGADFDAAVAETVPAGAAAVDDGDPF